MAMLHATLILPDVAGNILWYGLYVSFCKEVVLGFLWILLFSNKPLDSVIEVTRYFFFTSIILLYFESSFIAFLFTTVYTVTTALWLFSTLVGVKATVIAHSEMDRRHLKLLFWRGVFITLFGFVVMTFLLLNEIDSSQYEPIVCEAFDPTVTDWYERIEFYPSELGYFSELSRKKKYVFYAIDFVHASLALLAIVSISIIDDNTYRLDRRPKK